MVNNSFDVYFDRFPLELVSLVDLLKPLSCDESAALCVYGFLDKMTCYCEEFNLTNEMRADPENENGWIRTVPISPFIGIHMEWRSLLITFLVLIGLEIPADTRGCVSHMTNGG